MRGVQVKLRDPLRMRAIPEHLRGVFTMRCYTNSHLPYLTLLDLLLSQMMMIVIVLHTQTGLDHFHC